MCACVPCQHPTTQFFTGRMPFLLPSQQRQSTEGIFSIKMINILMANLTKMRKLSSAHFILFHSFSIRGQDSSLYADCSLMQYHIVCAVHFACYLKSKVSLYFCTGRILNKVRERISNKKGDCALWGIPKALVCLSLFSQKLMIGLICCFIYYSSAVMLWIVVDGGSWQRMSDYQDGCERVNVSSGTGLPV